MKTNLARASVTAHMFALGMFTAACGTQGTSAPASSSTEPSPSASVPIATEDAAALDAIFQAEQRRLAARVLPEHIGSRSVRVRVGAARALARAGGPNALPGLLRLLGDDHPEVVVWSAYGLGFWCKGHEQDHVKALTARAASLLAGAAPEKSKSPPPESLAPLAAIARAVGACGGETAEATLAAWLSGAQSVAEAAALGLGDLAAAKQKLREETLVALLQRAAGNVTDAPLPAALYPIGRIEHPPPSIIQRIREVASEALKAPGPMRLFAVRALGRGGEEAAPILGGVLSAPGEYTAGERGEAARALTRLSKAGQRALAAAVPSILPSTDPVALTGLVSEDFGATLAALEALTEPGSAEKALRELAARPPPPTPPAPVARRLSWLRCTAAKLVVGKNFRDPLLTSCEIQAGSSATPNAAPSASSAPNATATSSASANPAPAPLARCIHRGARHRRRARSSRTQRRAPRRMAHVRRRRRHPSARSRHWTARRSRRGGSRRRRAHKSP
ncbi:MAG: hypothetical protein IPK82_44465 [Polyangiaceae bacterium]|nr:hypothetical protein [Polyangiaceae bacterium]